MGTIPYVNAKEVLPKELVDQIQKHFRGGCLYVSPRRSISRIKRNMEIVNMRNNGKTITEIAETFMLSRRGVRYVLEKAAQNND